MPKTDKDKPTATTKGYAEPQPVPVRKHQSEPDENTPHEAQNVPSRKPKADSG